MGNFLSVDFIAFLFQATEYSVNKYTSCVYFNGHIDKFYLGITDVDGDEFWER